MAIRIATVVITLLALHFASPGSAAAQEEVLPDTLPQFEKVTGLTKDSVALVKAADDALQGQFGVTVPMVVHKFVRTKTGVFIELLPEKDPRVVWRNTGGDVRILNDGKRIILVRR